MEKLDLCTSQVPANPSITRGGFTYVYNRTAPKTAAKFYRCSKYRVTKKRPIPCQASITFNADGSMRKDCAPEDHNCVPIPDAGVLNVENEVEPLGDLNFFNLNNFCTQMRRMIDNISSAQRKLTATQVWEDVFNAINAKYPGVPLQIIRKPEGMSRVHYVRHGGHKSDRLSEIEQPDLAFLSNQRSPFLAFNTPVYEGTTQHRVCGWGHPGLYSLLKTPSAHIFVDATFRSVPSPFYQLLILMIRDFATDLYLPVFYVLMTGKRAHLYRFVFSMINTIIGASIAPAHVYCDFEQALLTSVKGKTMTNY